MGLMAREISNIAIQLKTLGKNILFDVLSMHSGAQEPGASFFLFPSLSQYLMILGEKYFETLRKYLYGISCHDYFVSVTKKLLKKEVVYFSLSFL